MTTALDLQILRDAVAGTAAAFRCVTDYQPVGGPGDKVFPPTYEGGKVRHGGTHRCCYGERQRQCVLLDSVQSQANRMELALLEAHRCEVASRCHSSSLASMRRNLPQNRSR